MFTTHLTAINSFNLPPQPVGIIKNRGRNFEIQVAELNIGENYAAALAKSLVKLPSIEVLNFRNNRLSDGSLSNIISSTKHADKLRAIDLTNNKSYAQTI